MSFLLDPFLLIILGAALYIAGDKLKLRRLAKITIGLIIVLSFISFSLMLYLDIFKCSFPVVCNASSGCDNCASEFMLHTHIWPNTGIEKSSIPFPLVVVFFLLYPVWIYLGYAIALTKSKSRKIGILPGFYTYGNVKSRKRFSSNARFSIIRYPDVGNNVTGLKDAIDRVFREFGDIWPTFEDNNAPRIPLKVLIKVNICGGVPDNPATYTSMDLVEYVVHKVRERGGKPIICDADMIWTKFWENARAIGWVDRINDINSQPEAIAFRSSYRDITDTDYVSLLNLSETDQVKFYFGEGTIFGDNEERNKDRVSKELLDADLIISIPKMKTHLLTGVTLGMKNMYGTFPEIDKAKYHKEGINDVIYFVNYAFPPTLTIIDGSIGGEAIGPLSANSVQYNTIIASRNVVIADAIASKLMGYDSPFDQITHLKLVKDNQSNQRDMRLLKDIPEDLSYPAKELIKKHNLPPNPKDGNWDRPDQEMADKYENFMEILLMLPLVQSLFNIGADFFLFDAARLPILKHLNTAILQILYEAPLHWVERGRRTLKDIWQGRLNLAIFLLLAAISIYYFFTRDYWNILKQSQPDQAFWFAVIFLSAIVLGALIARRMRTRYLLAITFSSIIVAFLVETFGPYANWWIYLSDNYQIPYLDYLGINMPKTTPLFAIFAIPISIIVIIGLSHYLSGTFSYVGLKGKSLDSSLVPYVLIISAFVVFLCLEIFLNPAHSKHEETPILAVYAFFALLGLYFNYKEPLEWNLALTILAVSFGFLMEFPGYLLKFWSYPLTSKVPIFLLLHWALNVYAVGGIALLAGINIKDAFPESVKDSDPRYWCHEGDELIIKGRYQKALEAYEKAIQICPSIADAWCGKGNAFLGIGRPNKALDAYERALVIDNNHAEALKRKGEVFLELDKPNEAINAYKAIAINNEDIDLWIDKALAYQHPLKGDFDESTKTYDHALEKNRNQDLACRKLLVFKGFAYSDRSDLEGSGKWYQDAINCFDESIALSNKDTIDEWLENAWWGKGYALSSLRRYEEANDAFSKLELCPCTKKSAFIWSDMGYAFYDQGKYEKALMAYNKSIKCNSESAHKLQMAKAYEGKGWTLHKLNRHPLEAVGTFVKSIELFDEALSGQKNIEALFGKGYALYKADFYEEALESYRNAIELDESFPQEIKAEPSVKLSLAKARTRKGIIYYNMHDREEALKLVEDALKDAPYYLPAIRAKEKIDKNSDPAEIESDVNVNPRYGDACQRRGASLRMTFGLI